MNYLTAYQMLVIMGSIRQGSSVLIHGAGGGVGTAAAQIARAYNAVIYGTGSAWKHDYMRGNGVDYPIDYRTQDFVDEIHRLTDGRGVQIVLDPLGGNHWKRSYEALRPTGRLVMFGVSQMTSGKRKSLWHMMKTVLRMPHFTFHPVKLINQNKGVLGVNLGHMWHEAEMMTDWIGHLREWIRDDRIHPHIDAVFPFQEAAEAHHYIQDRKNLGKVCLEP